MSLNELITFRSLYSAMRNNRDAISVGVWLRSTESGSATDPPRLVRLMSNCCSCHRELSPSTSTSVAVMMTRRGSVATLGLTYVQVKKSIDRCCRISLVIKEEILWPAITAAGGEETLAKRVPWWFQKEKHIF